MSKKFYEKGLRFECQVDCATCCELTGGFVFISENEVKKIAGFLNCSPEEVRQFFTWSIDEQLILINGEGESCIFLENRRCTIYEVRPAQCRHFPFWPENLRSKSAWQKLARDCPGINQGKLYSEAEIRKFLKQQNDQ